MFCFSTNPYFVSHRLLALSVLLSGVSLASKERNFAGGEETQLSNQKRWNLPQFTAAGICARVVFIFIICGANLCAALGVRALGMRVTIPELSFSSEAAASYFSLPLCLLCSAGWLAGWRRHRERFKVTRPDYSASCS